MSNVYLGLYMCVHECRHVWSMSSGVAVWCQIVCRGFCGEALSILIPYNVV